MPERGEKRGTRIRPQSITIRTPSMVRLVSAIEVASTTLRRPGRRRRDGAVLVGRRQVAVERRHVDRRRRGPAAAPRRGGSRRRRAGRPGRCRSPRRAHRGRRSPPCPRCGPPPRDRDSASRPGTCGRPTSTSGAPPSRCDTGPGSSVADMAMTRRSSRSARLRFAHQGEGEVGLQPALVQLVEDHAADARRAPDRPAAGAGTGRRSRPRCACAGRPCCRAARDSRPSRRPPRRASPPCGARRRGRRGGAAPA